MKIQNGYLYFIKDLYFEKVNDKELLQNKKNGNKRPSYYCFEDNTNDHILWFVPISSRVEKYKRIYNYKIKKQLKRKPDKRPEVDTIEFGYIGRDERVFLIQNMFPVIEKYIIEEYKRNNIPVRIDKMSKMRVDLKSRIVLNLVEKGHKSMVFPDILKIKDIMKSEIIKDMQIKDFFNDKNKTFKDEIKRIFNNAISKEDIELYIDSVNNNDAKNDLIKILKENTEIISLREEINEYIDNFSDKI